MNTKSLSWKDSIFIQREQLARLLEQPLREAAGACASGWDDREALNALLRDRLPKVPYCTCLYCVDGRGIQICDNIVAAGVIPGHYGRDRSFRPYMQERVPPWGFLLSDAYISQSQRRPSLTALQRVQRGEVFLGYLGADFDLRDLPVTSVLYEEPHSWRQIKGDPAIRGLLFQQSRVESPLDRIIDQALVILSELITSRGVFQCQVHFSSSQAVIWTIDDPFQYRLLDHEALGDADICLVYDQRRYPLGARLPADEIDRVLETMRALRVTDQVIYLRSASINVFNGMVSVTFSCDGSHYMPYSEFLSRGVPFWFSDSLSTPTSESVES